MQTDDKVLSLVNETVKDAVKKARWKYSEPPLGILGIILMIMGVYSLVYGYDKFFVITPDILIISAIIVIFFGAWYDFGASSYVKDLKDYYRKSLNNSDLTYINKQQLVMTLIYMGIGVLYIATGIAIYIISLYI